MFPRAQESPLKNTGEHESSLQHDLRGGLSCQLQARATMARVTCLGGDKLSKPSGEASDALEQANCTQNWYLARAPSWQGNREPRLSDWDSCGPRLKHRVLVSLGSGSRRGLDRNSSKCHLLAHGESLGLRWPVGDDLSQCTSEDLSPSCSMSLKAWLWGEILFYFWISQ